MPLSLTKPGEGTTGWANAINQNFTDIESALGGDVISFQLGGTAHSLDEDIPGGLLTEHGHGVHFIATAVLPFVESGGTTIRVLVNDTEIAEPGYATAAQQVAIEGWIMRESSGLVTITTIASGGALPHVEYRESFSLSHNDAWNLEVTNPAELNGCEIQTLLIRRIGGTVTTPAAGNEDPGVPQPTSSTMPTVRVKRCRGATPGGFRLSGGTTLSSLVDNQTFGAVESGTLSDLGYVRCNDWVEFKGKEYYLNTSGTTSHNVYERPAGGSVNTTAVNTNTATVSFATRTGLVVVNSGDQSFLCYVWWSGANSARLAKYDGTTWSNITLGTTLGTISAVSAFGVAVVNGVIYIPVQSTSDDNAVIAVNVASETLTQIQGNQFGNFTDLSGCCVSIYGRVFYFGGSRDFTGYVRDVYEIVGSGMTVRASFANFTNFRNTTGLPGCIFPYGDSLIVVHPFNNSTTAPGDAFWKATQLTFDSPTDNSLTQTDVSAFLPSEMKATGGISYGIFVWIDTETDPSNPQYNFWWTNGTAGTYSYARLTDLSTQLSGSATGVDPTNWSIVAGTRGGGEQISPDDANDVVFEYVTVARSTTHSDRAKVSIEFQSVVTADTFIAKLWYSTKQNRDFKQATLTGSPTGAGTSRVGNEIRGCAHNTAITFEWDLGADLIADNTQVELLVKLYREA